MGCCVALKVCVGRRKKRTQENILEEEGEWNLGFCGRGKNQPSVQGRRVGEGGKLEERTEKLELGDATGPALGPTRLILCY